MDKPKEKIAAAPAPTLNFNPPQTTSTSGFNFSTGSAGGGGFNFGLPPKTAGASSVPSLNFCGPKPTTAPAPLLNFNPPSTVPSLTPLTSTSQPQIGAGLMFPMPTSTQPSITSVPTLGSGLTFSVPTTGQQPAAPQASATALSGGFTLPTGTPLGAAPVAGGGGLVLGAVKPLGVAASTIPVATTASLPTAAATTTASSILPPSTTQSAAPASTSAPIAATATTTVATSVPAPASTTVAATPLPTGPSVTFTQFEDMINKWTSELGEMERLFLNQATQVNAWDHLLATNCAKLANLNSAVERVKSEQKKINYDLDFILAQQKELDACLQPLEKEYTSSIYTNDVQREKIYLMAENIDSQLKRMSEDLKETIEHINETSRSQESVDPVLQIGKVLNAHMNSLQWIDENSTKLQSQLEQIGKAYEGFKRTNERFDNYYW